MLNNSKKYFQNHFLFLWMHLRSRMNFGIVGSLGLLSNQFHLIICVLIIFTKTDFMAENPVDVSDLKSRLPSTVPESVIRSTLVKVSTVQFHATRHVTRHLLFFAHLITLVSRR